MSIVILSAISLQVIFSSFFICHEIRVSTNFINPVLISFARSSFCSGLGDFSDVKPSGMLDDLDLRMSLDYLPFLRAMAVEENNADKRYHEAMEEVNVGALGMLQVGNIGRRSTRRAAKAGREHYFNRMISGQGVQYEEARTRARQISDELSNEILHY